MPTPISQLSEALAIDAYDYPLPDERIARHPLADRDMCKLLVCRPGRTISSHIFRELPDLIPADSMLVYNNTRVINARLRFRKPLTGALIEIFCLEPADPADYALNFAAAGRCVWKCMVGNSKKWKEGVLAQQVAVTDTDGRQTEVTLCAARREVCGNTSTIEFTWDCDQSRVTFAQIISAAGEIPIPPYLNRSTESSDTTDYQTVFGHIDGSVAAPTAGLHFTDEVLDRLDRRGVRRRELTLHVGAGTFQPVKTASAADHTMHSEFIAVSRELISELSTFEGPVIAVGTTSVRTLESLYHLGCMAADGQTPQHLEQWYPYSDSHPGLSRRQAMEALLSYLDRTGSDTLFATTQVMICPGYRFRTVDGIITNFHQPRSTLLLLVSAFLDGDWRRVYDYALDNGYRFLSYGDANLYMRDSCPEPEASAEQSDSAC